MFKSIDKETVKFLASSSMATFLEFLDFGIFLAAMTLIAHHFFPQTDSTLSSWMAWGSLSIGFLVRPIGAILFGHIGDKIGCKKALVLSILLMSSSSLLIGLLPSYERIGYLAPVILIVLRVFQGLGISPEFNGASVYISQQKHLNPIRGFLCSFTVVATLLGYITGSWIIVWTTSGYEGQTAPSWTWQAPLVITSLLVGIGGLILRLNMHKGIPRVRVKIPFISLLKTQKHVILVCCLLSGFVSVTGFVVGPYITHYQDPVLGLKLPCITIICAAISGFFADKFNRLTIMRISLLGLILSAAILFTFSQYWAINMAEMAFLLAIFSGFFAGPFPAILVESFSQQHRYTGAALGQNLGVALLGAGTANMGLALTMRYTSGDFQIILYPAIIAVLTLFSLKFLTSKQNQNVELT